MPRSWQQVFLESEGLGPGYLKTAERIFDPLAAAVAKRHGDAGGTLLVGLNGSQGSGKSTLCAYLCRELEDAHGLRAIDLSLDDFYLTRREREHLARDVHPLLRTRGVPGTHDIGLLMRTLDALTQGRNAEVQVPRFDKAEDDRYPASDWTSVDLPLDVVFLEGWCMGARALAKERLTAPLNRLEREEDPGGVWRRYVNERLERDFEPLYAHIDWWVMLAAPSFEQVLAWRTEQENKLRVRRRGGGAGIMDAEQLRRFVDHYERLTRQCLQQLPHRVQVLLQMDRQRNIIEARGLET